VVLSISPLGHRIAATVEPVKSTLLGLFFLSVGLGVDLRIVSLYWGPLLMHTGGILLIKFAVIFGLATVLGLAKADALRLSLTLMQCGEFGFVLFGAAQVGGLLTADLSALASILIMISMLATPLLVRLGDRLAIGARR
jgi:Kef-type K+ transport system membrane component KefB